MMPFLRKHLPVVLILILYVACIVAVDPRGEFPLNDDWSYTRSAFAFGSGAGMKVDEWSAPSLVGQAFYGGLLTSVFSRTFLTLRISTLLLSCATALLLWAILQRLGFRRDFSAVMLLAWLFNPLQFNLAFTFMTEIPFIFFVALATYLFLLHLRSGKAMTLALSAATLGYAYMIRQTALFFILGAVAGVLIDRRRKIDRRAVHCALFALVTGVMIGGYYFWTANHGGATAAVQRKFDLLSHLTRRQILGNGYGMLFYLALMLLPVWLFLLPFLRGMSRGLSASLRRGSALFWSAVVVAGVWWFAVQYQHSQYLPSTAYHARMPFLLNVLYDSGLGPITLDPDYFGPSSTPIYPTVWIALTALVAIGAVVCTLLCTWGVAAWRRRIALSGERGPLLVSSAVSLVLLMGFEIVFSHVQEGGLFDRHILIAALPFGLVLAVVGHSGDAGGSRRGLRAPAFVALAPLMLFCVAATHDYFDWNRIRWEMGRELLRQNVDPLTIAGGFEFNAWNNYDTFVARGNVGNVHHWWYDRRDYLISMRPASGCEVLRRKAYVSWVHRRPINLYLMRTATQPLKRE